MKKLTVALLSCGDSPEREVSLNSGSQVADALDLEKYDVVHFDPRDDLARSTFDRAEGQSYLLRLLRGGSQAFGEKTDPRYPIFRAMRATVYMSGYGELEAAAALLEGMGPRMDPEVFIAELNLVLYTERYDQALALIEEYDALLSLFPDGAGDFLRSWITGFQGDEAASLIYAERVVEALEPQVRSDDIEASSWKLMAAEAHARLGNDQEALRFARAVLAMNPRERDAFEAPQHRAHAARVIALAGEVEEGLDVLAPLVAAPSGPSRWELRLHPVWRFLDDQPRFRALAGI